MESTNVPTGGAFRIPQRPRSLCEGKLLSVNHSAQQTPRIHHLRINEGEKTSQTDVSKYGRGSWPNNIHQSMEGFIMTNQQKAPSMKALMNTTVPQKIIVRSGGRHHPTRSSLRHSRMVSLSQQGKVPRKYLPPVIHHYRTGSVLVAIQLVLGSVLLTLALHLLLWSPELHTRDAPYWSGASLILSGVFGLFLLCCCRKQYPGMKGGCCIFVVRVQYIVCNACLAMVATTATLCACVFASVHVSHLLAMECLPSSDNATWAWTESPVNSTCLCSSIDQDDEIYTYDPLSCSEVKQELPVYLIASAVTNGLACLISSWYIILLWSNRFAYTYAGLKLAEQKANAATASFHQ